MSTLADKGPAPKAGEPTCLTCSLYRFDQQLTDSIGGTFNVGRCYLEPPVYIGTHSAPMDPLLWEYPGVRETDFCSHFTTTIPGP